MAINDSLTGKIIHAAFAVFNKLGFGLLEKVYENALLIELWKHELSTVAQVPLSVYYDDQIVGDFYVDLLVEKRIVVELKSVINLYSEHEAQLVNYLVATQKDIGLLINFGPNGVEVKRKYRTYRIKKEE